MIFPGAQVEHAEFGIGKVLAVLGSTVTVEFFGERLDVDVGELVVRAGGNGPAAVPAMGQATTDLAFRRSFEAVNLGVVPADPDQLVKLTIGGNGVFDEIRGLLRDAQKRGVCRIYMGYYGSGKSHHLRLVKAIALREGWVIASIELDPKAADPAKPSSVYQELLTGLEFPMRADGTRSEDFFDLIKEMRDNWTKVRSLRYFRCSPWFSKGLEALLYLSHRHDDPDYVSAVSWLAGQVKQISAIRWVNRHAGYRESIPAMPQSKDTGLLYAFHLVVIHEVLKALGYRGLAIIIDEAEHVRTYSANRYVRANNFFDILARCAHRPRKDLRDPLCDYDVSGLPPFWREGPHFGLFVGLTEGEDTQDLRRKAGEMSVLIHSPKDVIQLKPPSPEDYEAWSDAFLAEAAGRLGPKVGALSDPDLRGRIAGALREHFEQTPQSERLLRNWTKMAGFPAAVLMSQPRPIGGEELVAIVEGAARQVAGEVLPWDD
ncbi:MAG TPA: BREX system ATP-binding domain-containing protein [Stellaceae bacterium]|nr:BREX system ATP-binding domain-containing protein [Stellaceae bacterium]